jgi:glycerol-3-phosphate acyltransferase PlsX
MKPGVARIRNVFDYERAGGSPLLGVRGTVIITHGRARRRMIGFGVGVAATMARTKVPELIGAAFAPATGAQVKRDEQADIAAAEAAQSLESAS